MTVYHVFKGTRFLFFSYHFRVDTFTVELTLGGLGLTRLTEILCSELLLEVEEGDVDGHTESQEDRQDGVEREGLGETETVLAEVVLGAEVSQEVAVRECDKTARQIWQFDFYDSGRENWRPNIP